MTKRSWAGRANIAAFIAAHLACLAALWTGVDGTSLAMCAGLFLVRKFGITAGYHRYFSHKSYRTSRPVQFLLAFAGCAAAQKGPLWWAAHHRSHHRVSDEREDIHSPLQEGFWWSHVGWVLSNRYDRADHRIVPDLARFPELRWLDLHFLAAPALLALGCLAAHGAQGLVWGFFISTTLLWHSTFLINSACHLLGRRRFPTRDGSRNSLLLALLTLGEGWHNNHHYYPSSANQGFYWWEIDISYYLLRLMSALGLVWDVKRPPERILALGRATGGAA